MFRRPISEWRKGGRLIEYLKQNDVRAVIMMGIVISRIFGLFATALRPVLPLFVNNDSNIHGDRRLRPQAVGEEAALRLVAATRLRCHVDGLAWGDQFFTNTGPTLADLPRSLLARF